MYCDYFFWLTLTPISQWYKLEQIIQNISCKNMAYGEYLNGYWTVYMGRSIIPKPIVKSAPSVVRNAWERSLGATGAIIFNLLPENIRSMNTDHIDTFKNHKDRAGESCSHKQPPASATHI